MLAEPPRAEADESEATLEAVLEEPQEPDLVLRIPAHVKHVHLLLLQLRQIFQPQTQAEGESFASSSVS
jgi:hypothetical protein